MATTGSGSADRSDRDVPMVEYTLYFEAPVSKEDIRQRCQAIADHLAEDD